MSQQVLLRVLIGSLILLLIALISERSRTAAGIFATMPINIPIALWLVNSTSNSPQEMAPFARGLMLGLIPTMVFAAVSWLTLSRGWSLPWVYAIGYAAWGGVLMAMRAASIL